jgi:hypothetical protein
VPKHIHCARCGKELSHRNKGIPSLGKVITVVEPHECDEEGMESRLEVLVPGPEGGAPKVDVETLPFVQKINEATQRTKLPTPIEDQRKGRDEVSSTAPQSLRGMIDTMTGRTPSENSGQEYSDDDRSDESLDE